MKKLRIERKAKPSNSSGISSSTSPSSSSSSSSSSSFTSSSGQAGSSLEDCFVLENVSILRRNKTELDTETPFGNNVIGFIGKAGVGKTTLAEIVSGTRSMDSPLSGVSGDNDDFGVTVHNANGMIILDSSSILSGILPPLKMPSTSLSLSSLYDLELVAFMFSVCNKIVVVQSQLHDMSVLECITSSFLLMEGRGDHLPEVIFALNRQNMDLPITTEDEDSLASKIQTALSPYYSGQTAKLFAIPDTEAEIVSTQSFRVSVETLYMELIKESASSSKLPQSLHINTHKDWVKQAEKIRSRIHSNALRLADNFQMKIK